MTLKTKQKWTKYTKQRFLDNRQQAVERCDPAEKKNKQASPMIALTHHLVSRPQHPNKAQQSPWVEETEWRIWGSQSSYKRGDSWMERREPHKEKFLEISWGFLWHLKLNTVQCVHVKKPPQPRKDHLKKQDNSWGSHRTWECFVFPQGRMKM